MSRTKQSKFDDVARWWFLTTEGFADFDRNPVAQGYEILSRHPDFPHVLADGWEHANKYLPRSPWRELGKSARGTFLAKHKFDLHRMGLLEIAWLGPRAVTFNCTAGVPSILKAISDWIAVASLFPPRSYLRTRSTPDLIKLITPIGNPDMVTLNWEALIKKRYAAREVVAAVRTFLENNPEYRQHRKSRIAELNKIRQPARPKKTAPATIALACVAWDCQMAGSSFISTVNPAQLRAISRKKIGDSRNHLRQLRKLQKLAGFKISPLSTRPAKQTPITMSPINVVSILYPGFRKQN